MNIIAKAKKLGLEWKEVKVWVADIMNNQHEIIMMFWVSKDGTKYTWQEVEQL